MVRTPKDIKEKEKLPVIFSIPAGGMTDCGTVETNVFTVLNSIKEDSRYIIVLTEYRIAPAYQYPAALNDLHASYNWILSNAEKLHINKNKIVITGGSAGGYLALCLGFRLKRYNWCEGPMPRGLVVVTPMMDDASQNQSYKITFENEVGEELNWTGKVNREAMKLYLGDRFGDQFLTPEAVPSHASLEDVKGMPPMWFPAQAENDPGRDSVYKLVSLLHEANIFCDLHMWGGAAHTTTTCVSTDFAQRMRSVERGAIRDAITFDFRRAWLTEE